jgi:predicted Na+-dependent transporter
MIGIVVYDILYESADPFFILLGLLVGMFIGVVTTRIFHISWHEEKEQVISKLDIFGILIGIAYAYFSLNKDKFVEYFVDGPSIGAIGFSIISGAMFGRYIGTRARIREILRTKKII